MSKTGFSLSIRQAEPTSNYPPFNFSEEERKEGKNNEKICDEIIGKRGNFQTLTFRT